MTVKNGKEEIEMKYLVCAGITVLAFSFLIAIFGSPHCMEVNSEVKATVIIGLTTGIALIVFGLTYILGDILED